MTCALPIKLFSLSIMSHTSTSVSSIVETTSSLGLQYAGQCETAALYTHSETFRPQISSSRTFLAVI